MWSLWGIAICCALLSTPSTSRSETGYQKKYFSFNLYGGFSIPNNRYMNGDTLTGYTGLALGIGVDIRPIAEVALCIDALSVTKGHTTMIDDKDTRFAIGFIEFPVRIKISPWRYFSFYTGPYLSALVVSAVKEADGTTSGTKASFKNDYGITAGLSFGIPTSSFLTLGLDVRYDHGFADIQNDGVPSNRIYTRAFLGMLVVGFLF